MNLLTPKIIFLSSFILFEGIKALPQARAATVTITGNPFASATLYANTYYANEVLSTAIPSLSATSLAPAASEVAKVPTFFWL